MKEKKEISRWQSIRDTFNTIHLWLGVGSGLILFIVCLTGTVYTFSTEIQKVTDSELFSVAVEENAKRLPTERLITHLLDSVEGGIVQSLVIPEAKNGSYQITVGKEERQGDQKDGAKESQRIAAEKNQAVKQDGVSKPAPQRPKGITYFVNPYTGKILGTNETSASAFFMFVFRLHRWLLLDTSIGRPIVGVATLIFVVIIITGWVIWFPKKLKNWKQGLKIKTSGNWKRINHDLHSTLGLYASVFLFVMALTGLTWSFEWYKTGFNNALGVKKKNQKNFESKITFNASRASIDTFLLSAEQALPYPGDYRISLPTDSLGVVNVMKTKNTFFATSVADKLALDQYSGAVINKELFSDKPFNEQIAASIKAIHIGSFYGTLSKIIYFVACLIGTSLPVTGVIIWINKLRKKNQKKAKTIVTRVEAVAAV
jgi:uncharacterized iron-regulated membrane protein